MKKIKDYIEMKANLEHTEKKIKELKEEQRKIEHEFEPKSDTVLRYEILGDPRLKDAKQELEELRNRRTRIGGELEEAQRKLKLTAEILSERKVAAAAEINEKNSKEFLAKAQVFAKKLREVRDLENELMEMRKKARKDLTEVDASEGSCKIPSWPAVLIPGPGKTDSYAAFCDFMEKNTSGNIKLG